MNSEVLPGEMAAEEPKKVVLYVIRLYGIAALAFFIEVLIYGALSGSVNTAVNGVIVLTILAGIAHVVFTGMNWLEKRRATTA